MKRFTIPVTPSTSSKSVWFPNDVIEDVKRAIRGQRLYFYSLCCKSRPDYVGKFEGKKKQACITGLFFFL